MNLDRTLEDSLTLAALRMALQQRQVQPGLVHHSDRGVQYASGDYTKLLLEHGIQISMSRKGNPFDNAQCESFIKTLKYEEIYRTEYRDLADARSRIREFIEKIYNAQRLHSALEYLSPVEFERRLPPPRAGVAGTKVGRRARRARPSAPRVCWGFSQTTWDFHRHAQNLRKPGKKTMFHIS